MRGGDESVECLLENGKYWDLSVCLATIRRSQCSPYTYRRVSSEPRAVISGACAHIFQHLPSVAQAPFKSHSTAVPIESAEASTPFEHHANIQALPGFHLIAETAPRNSIAECREPSLLQAFNSLHEPQTHRPPHTLNVPTHRHHSDRNRKPQTQPYKHLSPTLPR